ncbi:hypothetical protein SCARD494_04659 [Seiridium cardinale]
MVSMIDPDNTIIYPPSLPLDEFIGLINAAQGLQHEKECDGPKRVRVVIVTWDQDKCPEEKHHIDGWTAALEDVFDRIFHYEVTRHICKLGDERAQNILIERLRSYIAALGKDDLVVFYYSGRSTLGPRSVLLEGVSQHGIGRVDFSTVIADCFDQAEIDIIMFMDCCYGPMAPIGQSKYRRELIAAAPFGVKPVRGARSFTAALLFNLQLSVALSLHSVPASLLYSWLTKSCFWLEPSGEPRLDTLPLRVEQAESCERPVIVLPQFHLGEESAAGLDAVYGAGCHVYMDASITTERRILDWDRVVRKTNLYGKVHIERALEIPDGYSLRIIIPVTLWYNVRSHPALRYGTIAGKNAKRPDLYTIKGAERYTACRQLGSEDSDSSGGAPL